MRKIDLIIIHCSASRANRNFTVEDLEACHKARGLKSIGYHYYITKDGEIYPCRPEGGLDANGTPADTRTEAQKRSMIELLKSLCLDYPDAEVIGHRDLPWVRKSCPCFDVKKWLKEINFHI